MRKTILMISALMMLMACGGKKAQTESADAAIDDSMVVDSVAVVVEKPYDFEAIAKAIEGCDDPQEQKMVAVRAFVEEFYKEWDKRGLLDYGYVKQYVTPNLLKYLADEYEFDCEGECLATWKFFYEGGGDVGEPESRQITARDESHVLVEFKYGNYEYDVLLTLIKDGDTFKIDSLKQERSEYIN